MHFCNSQPGLGLLANTQGPLAILISPLKYLVCVYSILTSHSRNRRAWDKRGLHNPTLLLPCPSQSPQGRGHCLGRNRIVHKAIVGQVKLSFYTAKSGKSGNRTLTMG